MSCAAACVPLVYPRCSVTSLDKPGSNSVWPGADLMAEKVLVPPPPSTPLHGPSILQTLNHCPPWHVLRTALAIVSLAGVCLQGEERAASF